MNVHPAWFGYTGWYCRVIVTVVGMFVLFHNGPAGAQPRFNGYLENRFFVTVLNNDYAPSRFKNTLRIGDYNRARVIMRHAVSENSSLTVAVDYFTYHGFLVQQLRQPGTGDDPTTSSIDQRVIIDRAYLSLYYSAADITIGKQRISWGRSLLWSPFDVFNRMNFFEPQEEKFGVNAFRVSVPLGNTSSIEGAFVPQDILDRSSAGLRMLWNWRGMEFVTSTIHFANPFFRQNIYGLEWKGDIGAGTWFEGAYFYEKPFVAGALIPRGYFRWLVGLDYSFDIGNGLILMAEFTHDESGEPDKDRYNYNLLFTGSRFLLARDYLYSSFQFFSSDITTWSTAILANINDGSVFFLPGLQHSLFPDTELIIGAFLAIAESGTEFNPTSGKDPLNSLGNSTYYAWLRVYF